MSSVFETHGAFSWCELMTEDVEKARAFYTKLLGWTLEDGDGGYIVVKAGEQQIGGMMKTPPEAAGTPSQWGAYVTVDDVDAQSEKAKALGGAVLVAPTDIPNVGRFSVIQDPTGATLNLISYT